MDVVYAVNGAQCNVSGIPVIHPCFRKIRRAYIIYLFGLLLVSLGYFFPTFIERISWYFYVYEGVFYGALLKNTERGTKIPISCGIFLLIAYGFWYSLSHDSQGVMPYLFII